jgi:hypothetical protein
MQRIITWLGCTQVHLSADPGSLFATRTALPVLGAAATAQSGWQCGQPKPRRLLQRSHIPSP